MTKPETSEAYLSPSYFTHHAQMKAGSAFVWSLFSSLDTLKDIAYLKNVPICIFHLEGG